jgi:D-3-phosphoglycerate dehydrogenase
MSKVLVTDYVHPKLITQLEELGYEVLYDRQFNPEKIIDVVPDLTGVIINSKIKMTSEVINEGKNLKFIGRLGSGLEIIDLDAAERAGIAVINTPEGNCNAVAEHAIGMLLSLSNKLIIADAEVRQLQWNREANRGIEISGKKIGIIGFGHTGQAFTRRIRGFDPDVYYYDPYVTKIADDVSHHRKVGLDQIYNCDIISFHVPLTAETKHMLDIEFVNNTTQKPIIINTSRGKVVSTDALLMGLKEGKLSGACIDVFENEKPHNYSKEEQIIYEQLFSLPNVVVSPHIAGWTHQSLERIATVLLNKLANSE